MSDEAVQIPLYNRRGEIVRHAIVSPDDVVRIGLYRWALMRSKPGLFYAARSVRQNGRWVKILMHREVLGIESSPPSVQGDHINRDTFDNRRSNLRVLTPAASAQNRGSYLGSTSSVRGVHLWQGQWRAEIRLNGRKAWSKSFKSERAAAEAVVAKRRELMPFAVEEVA